MTRLVAFGCSHTFGEALPDIWDYEKKKPKYGKGPSKYAWPQLLADKLNIECVNLGRPGSSNKEIWYHIVNFEFNKDDIVIILWTVYDRWCTIHNEKVNFKYNPEDINITHINVNHERKRKPNSIAFFKYFHFFADVKVDYYMRVNYVSMWLKNKVKILKHYRCTVLSDNYGSALYKDDTLDNQNLTKHPDWFISKFEKEKFYFHILEKYPKAEDNEHCGIEGHDAFANLIYKNLC